MLKVLILGGTSEAAELASRLDADGRFEPVTSLAGRTRSPRPVPGGRRRGGFGGAAGMAAYLRSEGVAAVVDATHPFAMQISEHAREACGKIACPLARLTRLPWTAGAEDDWREVETVAAAASVLAPGARAFVTTGRQELGPFLSREDIWILVRVIDPLDEPLLPERGTVLSARGPFTADDEVGLMREHGIEWLVSKNSGGRSSYAKIEAARQLRLPVIMVRQPVLSAGGQVYQSPDAVIDWLGGISD